ncbi:MAG: diaminopimelate dehydrogenase [Lachnospiraceae bacterium]|nr:diaminopimelate dehydrogenase [Lachnospiraceae bacterium]MBP5599366.1 diaminopimelate dehydrogenase [Lachnospiraceae bacterium]
MNIAILGYGNLGRGVECAVKANDDAKLVGVYTRRDPKTVSILTQGVPVRHVDEILDHKDEIDVLIICGGSATDLPKMTPEYAKYFNVIDSFDTHARIPEHFANVDKAAKETGHTALISAGWDPGMFSLNRLYANCVLPKGSDYTFWGKGVSQGHSDAIRRIDGVKDGKQYTIPVEAALEKVRNGENPTLTTREKHTRECFVVAEEGADLKRIENEIKTMPNYFSDYDTTVHFISQEELDKNHAGIPHGGFVIRSGNIGWDGENKAIIEYSLKLDSNPEFTASVIVAYARAIARLNKEGSTGCKTVFDIAPAYLSALSDEDMRAHLL